MWGGGRQHLCVAVRNKATSAAMAGSRGAAAGARPQHALHAATPVGGCSLRTARAARTSRSAMMCGWCSFIWFTISRSTYLLMCCSTRFGQGDLGRGVRAARARGGAAARACAPSPRGATARHGRRSTQSRLPPVQAPKSAAWHSSTGPRSRGGTRLHGCMAACRLRQARPRLPTPPHHPSCRTAGPRGMNLSATWSLHRRSCASTTTPNAPRFKSRTCAGGDAAPHTHAHSASVTGGSWQGRFALAAGMHPQPAEQSERETEKRRHRPGGWAAPGPAGAAPAARQLCGPALLRCPALLAKPAPSHSVQFQQKALQNLRRCR